MNTYSKNDILNGEGIKKYDENIFNRNLNKWLDNEINKIIRNVITFPNKLKYKYDLRINISELSRETLKFITINEEIIKKEIIRKIRDTFPDCKIEIDPLNTYVLITWE